MIRTFQSTLPARGATFSDQATCRWQTIFQSTLPARGATAHQRAHGIAQTISIHAPRTGSDTTAGRAFTRQRDFNPRSPHGERRQRIWKNPRQQTQFQSTLPARGATSQDRIHRVGQRFQSTLPARGATRTAPRICTSASNFNPRSPHGERRQKMRNISPRKISIHAPRTGSDGIERRFFWRVGFQSTLPARGAT